MSPQINTASPRSAGPKAPRHGATPGGYGGKPPGVAFIGVPTGARNAGCGAPTGDQSTDMNATRKPPRMCQDPITSASRVSADRVHRPRALSTRRRVAEALLTGSWTWLRTGLTRRDPPFWKIWAILHESANVVRLTAPVCENHGHVWDEDRKNCRYRGHPSQVVDEQENRDAEADRAEGHHDEVTALPVGDVLGHRTPSLRDQLDVAIAAVPDPHAATVFPARRIHQRRPAGPLRSERRGQLAWLTDDMLKPSTRTGGITTRLK